MKTILIFLTVILVVGCKTVPVATYKPGASLTGGDALVAIAIESYYPKSALLFKCDQTCDGEYEFPIQDDRKPHFYLVKMPVGVYHIQHFWSDGIWMTAFKDKKAPQFAVKSGQINYFGDFFIYATFADKPLTSRYNFNDRSNEMSSYLRTNGFRIADELPVVFSAVK